MTVRIGYVGLHIATYFAEEEGQIPRASKGLSKLADELGFELVEHVRGIMNLEAAEVAAKELAHEKLDMLIIQAAACCMADVIHPFAEMGIPLGIWATPEPSDAGEIRLNSFVTASMFASTLRRFYRDPKPFKWFYGHVEESHFRRRLEVTVGALRGRHALATARVLWVGGLAPGFENLIFDPRDLHRRLGGAKVVSTELRDLVEIARGTSDDETKQVAAEMVAAARAVNVASEHIERNARLYLALRSQCRLYGTNAVALQDWSQIQDIYDISPLLALCWLAERDGIPCAPEGDVIGAITMRMLGKVAGRPATVMDIGMVDVDREAALLWHLGGSPHSLADANGVTYEYHTTLGRKQKSGPWGVAVHQTLAPGECTIAYLSDDARSLWNLRAEIFADPDRAGFEGDRGWIRGFRYSGVDVPARDLVETLLTTGQEHHHGVVYGDISEELSELAAWMAWREIEPMRYRDAMQWPGRPSTLR